VLNYNHSQIDLLFRLNGASCSG